MYLTCLPIKTGYFECAILFRCAVFRSFTFPYVIAAPKAPVGGASIAKEIGKPIKARKFGSRLRTYVRTHGLGLGTNLS